MHGREDGENWKRIRHMWSVAPRASTAAVGVCSSNNSFFKDGRKINIGDCALFKPPNDSPPFVGIIRSLSLDKENSLIVAVNWLYRPAEVVLGKGVVLESAPNEVFYSFHRDETPAASLLHPCKVAFLPKGVELPSGVSSFICRRVYDIRNKCLWWLTDKDYNNDQQEEIDELLQKSRFEMQETTKQHQGTPSPKPVNGATVALPLKRSPDSMQSATIASHPKGKKRELGDQTTESVKRIKDGGESVPSRSEIILKTEITKIIEKGGLVDYESVGNLVQLMQTEKSQKKIDLSCRSILAGIIASTDRFDCLDQFVQLGGLPFLDAWLQEVHKGKVGDSNSSKGSDNSVEDFLFVLLRALDKVPVNLNALQTCNIGKSVNYLRSHKNLEIQKKSRSLVDMWKKRVAEEMKINDSKSASAQPAIRSSGQLASVKSGPLKPVNGDTTRAGSVPSGSQKTSPPLPVMNSNYKEELARVSSTGGGSDLPLTSVKDEKSTSSSQSRTNSQCSSDHARNIALSGKEDARSSTAWSKNNHKTTGLSHHQKSANGPQLMANRGAQKDLVSIGNFSFPSVSHSEKFCKSALTCENNGAAPVSESSKHKIIVKIPNKGHSPGQVSNIVSNEDPSSKSSRAPSPAPSEKPDETDASLREKISADENKEVHVISAVEPDEKQLTPEDDAAILSDASKSGHQCTGTEAQCKISDASSMNSMNALVESCVKYSEAHASIPVGDNSGMNLLASVATGEISKSSAASPAVSPQKDTVMAENVNVENEGATRCNVGATSRLFNLCTKDQPQNGGPFLKSNGKLDEFAGDASISQSPSCVAGKNDEGGREQILLKATVVKYENDDLGSGSKQISKPAQDEVKDDMQSSEGMSEATEDSLMFPVKNNRDQLKSNALIEHEPTCLSTYAGLAIKVDGQTEDVSCADEKLVLEQFAKKIVEDTDVVVDCKNVPDCGHQRNKQENNASLSSHREEGSALVFVGLVKNLESKSGNFEHKEREAGSQFCSKGSDIISVRGESKDVCASSATTTSVGAIVSETAKKLEFDLNECFDMDDVINGDPSNSAATAFPPYINASQSAVSSVSCGLPGSVTVTSAAKGPFVPPEDLLRNKAELGWKGSAATSAFRPAEPRKLLDSCTGSNKASLKDSVSPKPVRPVFDFDLNVSDDNVLQDSTCLKSTEEVVGIPGSNNGGLDLDLNKVDDVPVLGHHSAGNFERHEVSVPFQSSNYFIDADISAKRNFDLNDGAVADESTYNQHVHGNNPPRPMFGVRMNNVTAGSLSSYYNSGTTYSAVTTPSALPEHPIIGTPGPHRGSGVPFTSSSFNTDIYRGSVLTTSPAVSFTTVPFQYQVLPLGTTFPFPTTSLPGGSAAYMDPSLGGRFYTPTNATQLMGPSTAVSNQYFRPCAVSAPEASSNGAGESSRNWVRQGLDLNSGPVAIDVEGRDETFMASRQFSAVNSRTLLDEQTRAYQAGVEALKRREPGPEGGWDADRMNCEQSSLQ